MANSIVKVVITKVGELSDCIRLKLTLLIETTKKIKRFLAGFLAGVVFGVIKKSDIILNIMKTFLKRGSAILGKFKIFISVIFREEKIKISLAVLLLIDIAVMIIDTLDMVLQDLSRLIQTFSFLILMLFRNEKKLAFHALQRIVFKVARLHIYFIQFLKLLGYWIQATLEFYHSFPLDFKSGMYIFIPIYLFCFIDGAISFYFFFWFNLKIWSRLMDMDIIEIDIGDSFISILYPWYESIKRSLYEFDQFLAVKFRDRGKKKPKKRSNVTLVYGEDIDSIDIESKDKSSKDSISIYIDRYIGYVDIYYVDIESKDKSSKDSISIYIDYIGYVDIYYVDIESKDKSSKDSIGYEDIYYVDIESKDKSSKDSISIYIDSIGYVDIYYVDIDIED